MKEYQLPLGVKKYSEYLSNPLPFFETQMIYPFLNTRISANYDKVDGEIIIKVLKLFCRISFFNQSHSKENKD